MQVDFGKSGYADFRVFGQPLKITDARQALALIRN